VSREVSVGLAQITGTPFAPEENRKLAADSARELFERGAGIVVLPELIVPGYVTDADRLMPIAESLDGPTVTSWRELAAQADGVVVGGFCEREGDRIYNTAVAVDKGGVALHYRKLHLFASEKGSFSPGDCGLPVAQTSLGTLGVCVCYDLRFVETARVLALRGAELVCVPTAWLPGFDTERWDADGYCPQARGAQLQANLDQVFIACASQAGPSGDNDFLGSSLICDPYGKTVLGPLPGATTELALATIDLDAAAAAQERGNAINPRIDRRTDVYGLQVGDKVL
jgi:predicted amidohydrolase